MIEYSKIIKDAYIITRQNLILWFFGLFLVGGFNLGFFRFLGLPPELTQGHENFFAVLRYFQYHPGHLAFASASVLLIAGTGLMITNWSKIMLVLVGKSILEDKRKPLVEQAAEARNLLFPVIRVSLMTSAVFLAAALVIFTPPVLLRDYLRTDIFLIVLSACVFLPVTFMLSALNIFASLFVILFKISVKKALLQATDLFILQWPQLLALGLLLMVIYAVSFVAGVGFILLVRVILSSLVDFFGQFKFFPVSAIIVIIRFLTALLFWMLFAGINAFFNIAVLRLFLEIVKPQKGNEVKQALAAPAVG